MARVLGRRGGGGDSHLIVLRRQDEDRRADLQQLAHQEFILKSRADWEVKTQSDIESGIIRRTFAASKEQYEKQLEDRRARLKQLFLQDEEKFNKELELKQDTPAAALERHRQRAIQLKQERERKRQEEVQKKLYQKWMESNDELRTLKSNLLVKQIAAERENDVLEKSALAQLKQQEESKWALLWELDHKRKIQQEEEAIRKRREGNRKTREEVDKQIQAVQDQREQARLLKERENAEMKQRMIQDAEDERMERERQLMREKQFAHEVAAFNAQSQALNDKKRREEEALDKKITTQAQADVEEERKQKQLKQKMMHDEMVQYTAYLERLREDEKFREQELDRLLNEQLDKDWEKRVSKWKQEAAARKKLLNEVTTSHTLQLRQKEEMKKQLQEEQQREKARIEEELRQLAEEDARVAEEKKQLIMQQDEYLRSQMDAHRAAKAAELEERQAENARIKQEAIESKRKLEEELARVASTARPSNVFYARKRVDWFN